MGISPAKSQPTPTLSGAAHQRTLLYAPLPDGSFRLLDWCLINTSIGAMMEMRPLIRRSDGDLVNEDMNLSEWRFTDIQPFDAGTLFAVTNSGGDLWPRNYARP